jgi:hypothetical protein
MAERDLLFCDLRNGRKGGLAGAIHGGEDFDNGKRLQGEIATSCYIPSAVSTRGAIPRVGTNAQEGGGPFERSLAALLTYFWGSSAWLFQGTGSRSNCGRLDNRTAKSSHSCTSMERGGKKVAVCFVLYVEVWGFGHGPNFRPDAAARDPNVVDESFRQYAINWGIPWAGAVFKEAYP